VQVVTVLRSGKTIKKPEDPRMSHLTVQEEEIANHSDSVIKTTLEEEQEPSKKVDKGKNIIEGTQFKPKPHFLKD